MDTAKLEAFISEKMSATRLPGLSIALVKGDEVVYSRGFGLADIARNRAATPQTVYGAASITKSLAAISILQLAEKGLLRLSDPVDRFLPCPIKSKDAPIRIEHLLTHTSGTPALGYIEAVLGHAHEIGGSALSIETYRGTERAKLTREGDLLRMQYLCGDQPPTPLAIVPERLDESEPRFFTYSDGQRFPIEFRRTSSGVEFIYERYKFTRTGPLV